MGDKWALDETGYDDGYTDGYNEALEDFAKKLKKLIPKDGIYTGQAVLDCADEVVEKLKK